MQQPEQISQTTTSRFDEIVEFTVTQNTPASPESTDDWTLLRQAAEDIGECLDSYRRSSFDGDAAVQIEENHAETVRLLVPKLLDAYADLWELSIALTKAVEQWKQEGQGGKLLVADGQEVRQFN